ncbi:hypothetical protein BHE75_01936 [Sphingomonas haloaromaticamans]|uniref:Uncharacterized protein n=1 Tax=Edaphosphingomonas haloaromaticamans TaxID=653954 RepID=A0A1S1HFH3_9SPHN|nr:hypothetical protein BHE75_01936 [Sphingomonas haloaromaticamans]
MKLLSTLRRWLRSLITLPGCSACHELRRLSGNRWAECDTCWDERQW